MSSGLAKQGDKKIACVVRVAMKEVEKKKDNTAEESYVFIKEHNLDLERMERTHQKQWTKETPTTSRCTNVTVFHEAGQDHTRVKVSKQSG